MRNEKKTAGIGCARILTSLIAILILSNCLKGVNVNILTNPGFESGTTGWAARGGSISAVTSPTPHSGTYCGRAYNRTATWNGIQQNVLGKMVVGQTYTVSGWVRTSSSASSTLHISFAKTDDNGTTYAWAASGTASSSGWVYISGSYTLNVTGTLTALLAYVEGPDSGIDIYVDDASVYGPEVGLPDPNATGSINTTVRHQVLEGFGAAGAWYEGTVLNYTEPTRTNLYNTMFRDLGLDIYRVRNTYDVDNGYITRSATIIQAAATSLGHPIRVMNSSWGPPAYLKSNNDYENGGTLIKDAYGNYKYAEFAQWWRDSLTAWSNAGVNTYYLNMQNEPQWSADWATCLWDPTENSTYAGYKQGFAALYANLNTMPDRPKLLAPESASLGGTAAYLNAFNSTDMSNTYGYAHHLYDGSADTPDQLVSAMATFKNQYGDKPIFQTEFSGGTTTTWTNAMNLAILMNNCLTVENVSAYLYWDLFWASPSGLISLTTPNYTINPVYYAFKHYSYFTDPIWQRVDTGTSTSNVRMSAFISPDNSQLSVVIINTSTSSININLSFTGFTIEDGNVYRSSSTQNCINIGTFNPAGPLTLPASSITTLSLSSGTVDTTPPAAPTGLSATGGESMVTLNWNDNTEIDLAGYNVYRSTTSGSGYSKINSSLLSSSNYTDNAVTPYVTYYYVVTAADTSANESGNSSQASAMPTDTTPPAAPAGLTATAGDGTVLLNWNDNSESDLGGYNVYRSTTSGSGYSKLNSSLMSSSDYIDSPVTNGITYYYVVTAEDIFSNESGYVSEISAMPNASTIYSFAGITAANTNYNAYACDVDLFPFAGSSANRNTMAEATDSQYTNISTDDTTEWETVNPDSGDKIFLWIEMKINELPADITQINLTFDGYTDDTSTVTHRIYVMKAGADWIQSASWVQVGTDQSISPSTYASMTRSITSSITDYIDGTGKIVWGVYETTSAQVMHINYLEMAVLANSDTTPPASPTGLSATAGNGTILLDWNNNPEPDMAGYNVYRSTTSGSGYNKLNSSLLSSSDYIDNTVTNGIIYYYVVTAVDTHDNESDYSSQTSSVPDYQNCADVQAGGYKLLSDLNGDCYVNFEDLQTMSNYWLSTDCAANNNCDGADFEPIDGRVDFLDFSDFAEQWMQCNSPVDLNCTANW